MTPTRADQVDLCFHPAAHPKRPPTEDDVVRSESASNCGANPQDARHLTGQQQRHLPAAVQAVAFGPRVQHACAPGPAQRRRPAVRAAPVRHLVADTVLLASAVPTGAVPAAGQCAAKRVVHAVTGVNGDPESPYDVEHRCTATLTHGIVKPSCQGRPLLQLRTLI